jgi:hypothetical protein
VPTIVRALGNNPSTAQLQALQHAIVAAAAAASPAAAAGAEGAGATAAEALLPASAAGSDSSSFVTLEQCEGLIASWLLEMRSSLARDGFHTLMQAFQALDPDNRLVALGRCVCVRVLCGSCPPPAVLPL